MGFVNQHHMGAEVKVISVSAAMSAMEQAHRVTEELMETRTFCWDVWLVVWNHGIL